MARISLKPWFHLAGVAMLSVLLYANTVQAPFYLDDRHVIKDNKAIRSVPALLGLSGDEAGNAGSPNVVKTRFLGILSFSMNYAIHGLDTAGYHLVNIAIHAVNSMLVYLLVLVTFRTPRLAGTEDGGQLALLTALAFAAHPLQSQAVTYLTQRFASLAVFFCLCSLLCYVQSRLSARKSGRALLLALAVLCSACAMITKENSFSMPVIIACYEFLFFKERVKRRLFFLAPLLLTMLIIPAIMLWPSSGPVTLDTLESATHEAVKGTSRADYAMTQARVVATYLRLFFFPFNQNLDYDYPMLKSLADPEVLLPLALLAGLLSAALFMLLRAKQASPRARGVFLIAAFGIFWFFLALSVESSFIPINDLIFEHRMYFPMPGLLLAVLAPFLLLGKSFGVRIIATLAIVWVVLLAVTTMARNALWAEPVAFAEDLARKSPNKSRPYINLGYAYEGADLLGEAARAYETSLRLKPGDALAHYNLGNVYFKQARYENAAREYQQSIALDPDFVEAHNNLGNTYRQLGRYEDAAREFRSALVFDPGFSRARNNLNAVEQILSGSPATTKER